MFIATVTPLAGIALGSLAANMRKGLDYVRICSHYALVTESDRTVPRAQADETWQEHAEVHDVPAPVLVPGGPGRYVVCGRGRTVGGERVVDLREAARELLAAEEAYRLAPTLERTSALARARRRVEEVLATDTADDRLGQDGGGC
jgi:hypothetical protein